MTTSVIESQPVVHIAKISTCNSLSGLTQLDYALGYEVGSNDRLHIRILQSNGNGKYNACWWSLVSIEQSLSAVPAEGAFTISALKPVFAGRSTNTLYFVLAALLDCGLLRRSDTVTNGYVRNTPTNLLAELQALIQAGTNLSPPSMEKAATSMATPDTKATKAAGKKSSKAVAEVTQCLK
jgi:hypothetical protein